jgi:hypothetical protein
VPVSGCCNKILMIGLYVWCLIKNYKEEIVIDSANRTSRAKKQGPWQANHSQMQADLAVQCLFSILELRGH